MSTANDSIDEDRSSRDRRQDEEDRKSRERKVVMGLLVGAVFAFTVTSGCLLIRKQERRAEEKRATEEEKATRAKEALAREEETQRVREQKRSLALITSPLTAEEQSYLEHVHQDLTTLVDVCQGIMRFAAHSSPDADRKRAFARVSELTAESCPSVRMRELLHNPYAQAIEQGRHYVAAVAVVIDPTLYPTLWTGNNDRDAFLYAQTVNDSAIIEGSLKSQFNAAADMFNTLSARHGLGVTLRNW